MRKTKISNKSKKKVDPVELQDRDKAVILDCSRHKGLPGRSIAKRYFPSIKRCNDRLKALVENEYLDSVLYAGELKKKVDINDTDNSRNGLKRGYKKSIIYYPRSTGQMAINYKTTTKASKYKPKPDYLDNHVLLGQIYERHNICKGPDNIKEDLLYSSSESHVNFNIPNSSPVLCSIPASKLIVVSALNKKDMSRPTRKSNLITMIEGHKVESKDRPVMFVIVAPEYLEKLTLLDVYYLPWENAPGILYNITQSLDYYKRSFQRILHNEGYETYKGTDLYWQATKAGKTYNISELVTGSTELMRSLRQPHPNTYIYTISRSHLYGVNLDPGYSFLIYSWKDKATYEVTRQDKHYFRKIPKGVLV